MRPGFLGGFDKMVPRAVRNQQRQQRKQQQLRNHRRRRGFHGLGAFGKGFVAPPPPGEPTTLKPPAQIPLKNAVNAQTNKWYQQDVRCPEGEIMKQVSAPCQGDECCDAPGDCDPPGTVYQELECDDDPAYRQLPPPPPGGFPDCDAFYKAGYLPPCNKETCASCFVEKKKQEAAAQPQQAQEAGPSQVVIIAPPPQVAAPVAPAGPSPEELALEQEIEELEDEAEELPTAIPQPEATPPPVYTGSPPPSVPRRAIKTGPASTEEKVQELVSQYQEQKVVERYQSPVRTIFMTGPSGPAAGPAPVRRGPPASTPGRGPGPAPMGPSGPPKPGLVNKVFGWLNQTLFG